MNRQGDSGCKTWHKDACKFISCGGPGWWGLTRRVQFSDCLRNKQDRNCWKLLLRLGFPAAVFMLSSVRFDKNYILSSESMIAGYQFVNDILKMCTVCQNCKHAKYTMHQFSILSVKLQKRHNLGACICMQYQMKILNKMKRFYSIRRIKKYDFDLYMWNVHSF